MQLKTINIDQEGVIDANKEKMSLTELRKSLELTAQVAGNDFSSYLPNSVYKPVPPPKPLSPPYRMPPQPPGGSSMYSDASIPGTAQNDMSTGMVNVALRTHSSKFPIERELVLTSDKGSSKIPLMHEARTPSGARRQPGALQLLPRSNGSIAPDHPPKHMQAWNSQPSQMQSHNDNNTQLHQLQQQQLGNSTFSGAIPRTPARLPEDVTTLADRDNKESPNKNAVTKTYHTLKDLISSKFKKDTNDMMDELNNVTVQQQHQPQLQPSQINQQQFQHSLLPAKEEEYRSPYSALPVHMRQNPSQSNIWNGNKQSPTDVRSPSAQNGHPNRSYAPPDPPRGVQQRANSQPQLNVPSCDRRGSQVLLDQIDRRGSLANIDVTDSDDGGFASRMVAAQQRRPQTMYQVPQHTTNQSTQRNSPQVFSNQTPNINLNNYPHQYTTSPFQHSHNPPQQHMQPNGQLAEVSVYGSPLKVDQGKSQIDLSNNSSNQMRPEDLRASFQKQLHELPTPNPTSSTYQPDQSSQRFNQISNRQEVRQPQDTSKPVPGSAGSSDYDKSGNQSSNVDSGRGSAAYSSGRKAPVLNAEVPESLIRKAKNDETEWVDIVDAELRHILEPGMQNISIRPESTVSGSVSSMSPPLPPLSPDDSSVYKAVPKPKDSGKQEYGTDSYNRPGRNSGAIGPSRAGWPGSSIQKQAQSGRGNVAGGKKHEQSVLKRHLFGLDNDLTSTTTRSLDLESLLGGPWGTGQSVSDSETDTQGIRHIRSQLEGLEHMYSEVLKMLGSRMPPGRMHENPLRGAARRRHGSLSSLPSSSVSGRPIRDRRRPDERRKIRDVKGINKRFQRLESHVVTLARSVAHLSSEMRSQHQVTQELERLRDDLTALRSQGVRTSQYYNALNNDPEPPNLTNPRRVRKLTKFFGEDPPLMRLFLKKLGYEKYANLFEAERVGMIELPYLGEERLQKLGVPLGPRLRILQEAQISLCKDTTLCIV